MLNPMRQLRGSTTRVLMGMATRSHHCIGNSARLSTNAVEVFDTEANRQQLEIISQQMEDAINKEGQMTRVRQVHTSAQTWFASGEDRVTDHKTSSGEGYQDEEMAWSPTTNDGRSRKPAASSDRFHIGDDLGSGDKNASESMGKAQQAASQASQAINNRDKHISSEATTATKPRGNAKMSTRGEEGGGSSFTAEEEAGPEKTDAPNRRHVQRVPGDEEESATQAGENQPTKKEDRSQTEAGKGREKNDERSRGKEFSEHRENSSLL